MPQRDQRSKRALRSRRQALDLPPLDGAPVAQPVVQPVLARLPEFDLLGLQHVPAPEVGHWHGAAAIRPLRPATVQLSGPVLELGTVVEYGRLAASPGAQLGATRPGPEVRLAVLPGQHGHRAFRGHLALQRVPRENYT